jgi:hypothetical protein
VLFWVLVLFLTVAIGYAESYRESSHPYLSALHFFLWLGFMYVQVTQVQEPQVQQSIATNNQTFNAQGN